MAVEAAQMFVTVTADVDKGLKGLQSVNSASQKTESFLGGAAKQALGFGTAMLGLNAGAAIFSTIKGGAIDMNAQLETSTLQFETLMGDADKAREHVEGLFDFAAKTPFETGPIIEASRLMETFGGAALNSKDNLTDFGNAAAATGQPINEVAFWMSRAYAAIQAGKPWGEAAQRLGEMGIVTPQVRSSLEDLQASGAKGPEVWDALTGSLGKFDGAMERQADTFDGMMSTFMDNLNMFLAKGLRPLFDGLKTLLGWANDLMSSDMFNGAMAGASAAVGAAFSVIGDAIRFLVDLVSPLIDAFGSIFGVIESGEDVVSGLGETLDNLGEKFGEVGTQIQTMIFSAIEQVLAQIPALGDAFLQMATAAIDVFIAAAPEFLNSILMMVQNAIDWVISTGVPMAADALGQFAVKFIDWIGPAAEKLAAALPPLIGKVLDFVIRNIPVLASKLVEWGMAFIGWVAKNVLPRLPGVLATIAGAIIGWIGSTAATLIPKMAELGGNMVAAAIDFIGQLPGKIGEVLGSIIGTIAGWAPKLAKELGGAAIKAGKSFANGIVGLIEGAVNAVIRGINSFQIHFDGLDMGPLGKVAAVHWGGFNLGYVRLPRFATGVVDVGPRAIPAMLDAHEAVLPRDEADAWRKGRGGGGDTYITVYIENFSGARGEADRLSRKIGEQVRERTPRRTVTSGARY